MKIHKFSRILSIPFFILLIIIGYFIYLSPRSSILVWALVPLMPLVLIYMFSPQLDYWWLSKNPAELDKPIEQMLGRTNPIYKTLNHDKKQEFDNRLLLFTEGREFIGKGMEKDVDNVPYDIKMMICQIPVTMTLNRKNVGFKSWERIILYKHPFPTPINKFLHTMETHAEDGVVILSLEHVDKALTQKGHHYDVAWHAYADAFIKDNPSENYPALPSDIWSSIEKISPQNKNQILGTLGFKTIDVMPILINLYFNYKNEFERELPDIKKSFDKIFMQDSYV